MAYDYLGCDNRRGFSQSMRRQKEPQARPGVARLGPKTAFVGVGGRGSCLAGQQTILHPPSPRWFGIKVT